MISIDNSLGVEALRERVVWIGGVALRFQFRDCPRWGRSGPLSDGAERTPEAAVIS